AGKKIAAMADVQDLRVAPHCSIGPVALAACLHFDVSTPNFMIQEAFSEFDVAWRSDLVAGWNPIKNGELVLGDAHGLGLELDLNAIAKHPYVANSFPSLGPRVANQLHPESVKRKDERHRRVSGRTHR